MRATVRYALAVVITLCLSGKVHACFEAAGKRFGINPFLLHAIAKTESSLRPDAVNRNKNGSYDIGLMQINSLWLPTLARHNITEAHLWDPCVNINVGAWILAQNISRLGNSWNAVGAYNTSKTDLRQKYVLKVYKNLHPPTMKPSPPNNDSGRTSAQSKAKQKTLASSR